MAPPRAYAPSGGSLFGIGRNADLRRLPLHGLGDTAVGAPFPASVMAWSDLVDAYRNGVPLNFLLAWIWKESNGNPCSYTSLHESGIYQLMAGDNLNTAGTTEAAIHPVPPCSPGVQTTAYYSSLNDDQRLEQVKSGMRYIEAMRQKTAQQLATYGYDWDETMPSFWQMVKMQHVAPAVITANLQQMTDALNHVPANWAEWRSAGPMWNGYPVPASWLDNAETVGAFGIGGGGIDLSTILGLAGLALAYVIYDRFSTGRAAHR